MRRGSQLLLTSNPGEENGQCISFWTGYRYTCVEQYAIHEFGHVIGMEHEWRHPNILPTVKPSKQRSPYIHRDSKQYKEHTILNKDYDWDSIMAYDKECAHVTGERFGSPNLSPWDILAVSMAYPPVMPYPSLTGYVNNDSKIDLVLVDQNDFQTKKIGLYTRTKLSNGTGIWTSIPSWLGDGPGVHTYPTLTGDVNKDGMTDLIFVGQNWNGTGLNIRTKLSNGDGTWTSTAQVLGDGPGVHTYPTLTGDVNGDGMTDLIFVGQNWNGTGRTPYQVVEWRWYLEKRSASAGRWVSSAYLSNANRRCQ